MNLCITGGGTGGHLMIAQALLETAVKNGHNVIFIGSLKGQDRRYFENEKALKEVFFLDTTGVVNQKGIKKFVALFKVFKAFLKSRTILKEFKIDATYSVGGFSAAPASFASLSKKIPLFIHEQNAVTGRLNSLLKPYSTNFISAYEPTCSIKGYPVKSLFLETSHVRKELKTIIFLGGSHGAKAINDLALSVASTLKQMGVRIIHQAGENDFDRVKQQYEKLGVDAELYSFTTQLPELINKSDFAISRAGASTLWELSSNGCPAFYVPYPYAASNHQFYNAKFIVDGGMGWCVTEKEDLKNRLLDILKDLDLEEKSKKLLLHVEKDVAQKMIEDVEMRLKC